MQQDRIPDQYVVVFKDDVPARDVAALAADLGRVRRGLTRHVYTHALKGFSARMSEAAAAYDPLDTAVRNSIASGAL